MKRHILESIEDSPRDRRRSKNSGFSFIPPFIRTSIASVFTGAVSEADKSTATTKKKPDDIEKIPESSINSQEVSGASQASSSSDNRMRKVFLTILLLFAGGVVIGIGVNYLLDAESAELTEEPTAAPTNSPTLFRIELIPDFELANLEAICDASKARNPELDFFGCFNRDIAFFCANDDINQAVDCGNLDCDCPADQLVLNNPCDTRNCIELTDELDEVAIIN